MKKIAEVAVPVSLALDETFDYRVPAHCRALLAVGCRVRIPFGRRQLIGYVTAFKNSSRYEKKLKALSDCLDPHGPLLNERLMSLARFLSREYFCSLAQGFETVLPRPLRTSINANIADVPTETTPSTPDPLTKEESAFLKQLDPSKPIYVLEDASRTDRWLAYRAWVKSTLLAGRDALFLVPDVAMIPYATGKLQCGVVPCIISSHEKPDAVRRSWTRAQKGKGALVIGTRSAVFAPFPDPGIIIMEQERHFAYRQQQVPNYHARDVALNLARESGAQLILGSHVPSLEAFGLVRSGQAAPLRFSNKDAPIRLTIVDMHQEFAPRGRSKIISKVLEFRIAEALEKKERLLFFIPQKAFSTYLYCPKCRKPLECERCSSPVSYYRSSKRLVCPSCRQEQEARDICPACLSAYVRYSGFGSEKVESELRRLFPDIRVAQFSKTGRQEEPCDIILATQQIFEELDVPADGFDRIVLVAPDHSLGRPDFRATEDAFARFLTLARMNPKELIVQTRMPEHYIWDYLKKEDVEGFLKREFEERRDLRLPPVTSLGVLTIRAKSEARALGAAQKAWRAVKRSLRGDPHPAEVFEPQPARPFKLRGYFRYQMLIKYTQLEKAGEAIRRIVCQRESGIMAAFDPAINER